MYRLFKTIIVALFVISFIATSAFASGFIAPTMKDKCAVCGMKVSMYPKWIAEIVFNDGTYAAFDGPKDMFRFYFNMSMYSKKTKADIKEIYVTDYYTTKPVKATDEDVYFIIGSDVYGPMGIELVPVKGKSAAETFMKDHKGKRMLKFNEVTPQDIPKGMMKMKMKMKKKMKGC
ncbi:MAG: nitrous oxide reductase accessory protein NosL [Nitrospirae bacterium]|nr:nitrous oxide reductase accessory protein NosL [Nitrospirota bacterium]